MHLARFDACNVCIVTTIDTEVGKVGRRQMLLSTLYGKHLRHAIAGRLQVAGEEEKNVHAAKLNNSGMGDEAEKAV